MKKLLIGLFTVISLSQESNALILPANFHQDRLERIEQTAYSNQNNEKFIFYENRERLNELKSQRKLPSFEVIDCYNLEKSLKSLINDKYYDRTLLYLEIIPFYYDVKAFIIYEEKPKETEEKKGKKNWWE